MEQGLSQNPKNIPVRSANHQVSAPLRSPIVSHFTIQSPSFYQHAYFAYTSSNRNCVRDVSGRCCGNAAQSCASCLYKSSNACRTADSSCWYSGIAKNMTVRTTSQYRFKGEYSGSGFTWMHDHILTLLRFYMKLWSSHFIPMRAGGADFVLVGRSIGTSYDHEGSWRVTHTHNDFHRRTNSCFSLIFNNLT